MKGVVTKWRKFSSNLPEKLLIFDFDDTLVTTRGKIRAKSTGETMDSRSWADFINKNKDFDPQDYDFSDFSAVIEPEPVKKVLKLMIRALREPKTDTRVVILTARHAWAPVRDYFMKTLGVDIKVVAINGPHYNDLDGSDAEKKAKWVENQIIKGYTDIKFWDDSLENAKAVKNLGNRYKNVSLRVFLVTNSEETETTEIR